ncbi:MULTISPECIES: transcriptional regulator [Kribbella]|nr:MULTISPECIES: transcriptional regulator [Kribbella]
MFAMGWRFAPAHCTSDNITDCEHLLIFLRSWQIRTPSENVDGDGQRGAMPRVSSQETVESALRMSDQGVSDRVNADIHGAAIKTIRKWRRLYQRQGLPRLGSGYPATHCPRCDEADLNGSAYAHLLGWYLGDGHTADARRGVYVLSISNDPKYSGLSDEIAATMRLVKPTGSPCKRGGQATRIEVRWKHWPCLFPQHGPGRKHLRKIELADWQQEIVARYPDRLLRGLFHSDGCRVTNWTTRELKSGEIKRYEYLRYVFANESEDIIGILTAALDLLEIPWRRPRRNMVAVSQRAGVEALDGFVGPKS